MKDRATIVCWRGKHILLVAKLRSKWSLPGGKPEHGEAMADAAVREMREETKITIKQPRLTCLYVDVRAAHHVFETQVTERTNAQPSNEIKRCIWVFPEQVSSFRTSSGTNDIVRLVVKKLGRAQ